MPIAIDAATIPHLPPVAGAVVRDANPAPTGPVDTFEPASPRTPNLAVTPKERLALAQGDLSGFWNARVGHDPIARLGVAFWGSSRDLSDAIDRTDLESWKPQLNFFTRLYLQFTAPGHVTIPPESKEELLSYWKYMGTLAETRLKDAIARELKSEGKETSTEAIDAIYQQAGLQLAHAHAEAVDQDLREKTGNTPGLLSAQQVSDYHHDVFTKMGLPASTYGGTPYSLIPDILELGLTSGLYAKGSDARG